MHPPDDLLLEVERRPDVARHVAECPRCRVHRRLLGASGATSGNRPPDARPTGHVEPDATGRRWRVYDPALELTVIHVACPPGTALEPLRRAMQVVERLAHPHIARMHAVHPGPPVRVVREWVEGGDLETLAVAGDPRGMAWLAQCASALAVLHREGVVHGGLTASDVRLTPDGRVKLVGLGAHPGGSPADDWRDLVEIFAFAADAALPVLRRLAASGEGAGERILAWLLAHRDPGASGGGRYATRSLLGIGGMGEVRRVFDPVLVREVARKELSRDLIANGERIRQFVEEARITAQLQHPGVVPVHDLEHLPNGGIAFTMKAVEGRTLGAVTREVHLASAGGWATTAGGWSLRRLVSAVRAVCDAVAYAHARGVVHLDLKPGNVMLGDFGEVQVFDWGLARRLAPYGTVTLPRGSGTAAYMPPEQASDGAVVGVTADVFALGATLREVLDGTPPSPGLWVPTRGDVPPELASVVRKAMAADPGARYATVRELESDLTAWIEGQWVGAHAYGHLERLWRRLRPHQAPLAVSVVAGVVLVALGAVSWVRVEGEQHRATLALSQALVDRANLALDANDTIRAESYAAGALGLADRPEARGLLAGLGRGWRPRLEHRWDRSCAGLAVDEASGDLLCATATHLVCRSMDGTEREVPGSFTHLRPFPGGGWTAVVGSTVVMGETACGPFRALVEGDAPIADAVGLPEGRLAVARAGSLDVVVPGAPGRAQRVDVDASSVTACGADTIAVTTTGGRLMVVSGSERQDLDADRVSGRVVCAPHGRALAVVADRMVQIWNLGPAVQRHALSGHLGPVADVAWSPDGRRLATVAEDGFVRVWSATSGREVGRIPTGRPVTELAFGADRLFAATDERVRTWVLPREAPVSGFDAVVEVSAIRWS
ncbi:MAG: protein kinase, partial [Myxococcales bacterium]|nr:protein kinase [Myxococcales bacterium]